MEPFYTAGLESTFGMPLTDSLGFSGNLTYMIESKNKTTGNRLSMTPKLTAPQKQCHKVDEGVREALDIVVDTSLPAARVVRVLEQLKAERGLPKMIRVDNGSEMTSLLFTQWCAENGVTIRYIEPGKPNQNAYIERFNKSYRNEVLDPHLFSCLTQVRELSWAWMISYNEERPHESLGNLPPSEFKRRVTAKVSSYELCA